MKPDWTLVANGTRARLLQQEPGAPMVILESFIHPLQQADESASGPGVFGRLEADWTVAHQHTDFARELAHLLEQEAQLDHFHALTVFAASPFLAHLEQELGKATRQRLAAIHEADLTRCTVSEIEERIANELAAHH
ncbi:host attachment protein [Ramlibacter sp.]|uniref:host attachment protein n=1 Tax=Ramlibacter sp. TaxID=1917967 RepID=UPI002C5EE498|nr:host attachment protein [Ramlibacter sp.]HWI81178.1 host attachment protein [Ramlibacter sp.]